MLLKNKIEKFKSSIKSNNVLTTLEERYCYSKDASNLEHVKEVPDLVVFVENVEDVQKVLKYANENEIPIVPRGAGTNMVGACTCPRGGIVLNFSKMNKIIKFNKINKTITVQPGVVLSDLKELVEAEGLFFPPDPSNYKVSTVGGGIALASGGARALKYGTFKDYVLSLKVVTSEGKLLTLGTNTTKNSFGYQMAQFFIGSEGTLGVVVEATLKLITKPEAKSLIQAYFNTIEELVNAVNYMLSMKISPALIDFMDNKSINTVENFANCGLDKDAEYLLLIELDGTITSLKEQKEEVLNLLNIANAKNFIIDDSIAEKVWEARCSSFAAVTRLAPDVVSDDIIVSRDKLVELIKICNEISNKYNLNMCLIGHIGDGNLHPQIALDLDDEDQFKNYIDAKSELYSSVISLGGMISGEHGVGIEKLPYFEKIMDSEVLNYMKLIKRSFDPKNIMNPGKMFSI